MTDALITQQDLELNYSPQLVRQLFCDDGSDVPGPRLDQALRRASAIALGVLRNAWGSESARKLATLDEGVKGCVCQIAVALGGAARPEYRTDDGKRPLDTEIQSALDMLKQIVAANIRPESEAQAGENRRYRNRTNLNGEFMFTPSVRNPAPGGY